MNRATGVRRRPKLILAVLVLSLLGTLAGPAPASAASCGFSLELRDSRAHAFWRNCTTVNQRVKVDIVWLPDGHPCIPPGRTQGLGAYGLSPGQVRHASLEGGC